MARSLRQPFAVTGFHFLFRPLCAGAGGIAASLLLALPAHAQSVSLPDPSGLTLFSLGVAGLILGRRAAARRKRDDDDQ